MKRTGKQVILSFFQKGLHYLFFIFSLILHFFLEGFTTHDFISYLIFSRLWAASLFHKVPLLKAMKWKIIRYLFSNTFCQVIRINLLFLCFNQYPPENSARDEITNDPITYQDNYILGIFFRKKDLNLANVWSRRRHKVCLILSPE